MEERVRRGLTDRGRETRGKLRRGVRKGRGGDGVINKTRKRVISESKEMHGGDDNGRRGKEGRQAGR